MSYTSFLSSQLSLVTVWFETNNLKNWNELHSVIHTRAKWV